MSENQKSSKFEYKRWIVDVSKWFTQISVLFFVAETGMQNGVFDDLIIKFIALFGFIVYLYSVGFHLLSEDYWIDVDLEESDGR